MSKNLVIVESPAKAKTIEKYLGSDYKVMSSVGHIRKDTKVDVNRDFAVTYEIDEGHKKIVSDLKKAVKNTDTVWLATDEDREGESISWHLTEVLGLPKSTYRITFHEITEPALKEAIKHPRKVDMSMVSSQQARQTLDMLVGYDLSGVVRRKVPGAISAGRVQSPALRLVVEKEAEIEKFEGKSSFKVSGFFRKGPEGVSEEFPATLDEKSLKTPLSTENAVETLLTSLNGVLYEVEDVKKTDGIKANPVPFATAALQIEANARLGFSSSTTMRAAQGLYQAGHITYHRTDSLNLSEQALKAIAGYIKQNYGPEYLHMRHFKTKSAGAQEAHEAIRPTHIDREVAGSNDFEKRLYNLIRTRTLATQMTNAKVAKTTITLKAQDASGVAIRFKSYGEVVVFDGFLKVYGNSKDVILPDLSIGDTCLAEKIIARQTFERPPARYTEGSLVKKLEELGIGRPSTYASIMSAIQARGYVIKGESDGEERNVTEYILEYSDDTADESGASTRATGGTPDARSRETSTVGESVATGPRSVPQYSLQKRLVKEKSGSNKGKLLPTPIGKLVSGFLTDNFENIVDYGFTADVEEKLDLIAEDKLERVKMLRDFYTPFSKLVQASGDIPRYNAASELGIDPKTGKKVYAKIGKNGGFIQLGDNEKETGEKPRFAPLPKGVSVAEVTLLQALKQLELPALPRSLGKTKDGTEIIASSGPFGPYLKAGKYNIQLKDQDPYKITLEEAEPLYQAKKDSIIADWGDISIVIGAYGPYIKGPGRRNFAKIPKDQDPKKITKEEAEKLLAEKPKGTRRPPVRRAAKKSAKTTAKTTRKSTKNTTKKK